MSRIGKMPITIPQGIEIKRNGDVVTVKGQKGELSETIHPEMIVKIEDGSVKIEIPREDNMFRSLHGLTRSLINNMVTGLTDGFEKKLEIVGVGYRAEIKGRALILQLGFSHPIYFVPPEGIQIETLSNTVIVVKGIDKQLVGQVSAKIRSFRPPEPYKGKGVRYDGEHVRRKAGKAKA